MRRKQIGLGVLTGLLVIIASFALGPKAAAYSGGGEGTEESPYQITNCNQLQSISSNLGVYYALVNDVNCSDATTWNSGDGFTPIALDNPAGFTGILDGRNYAITNLYINRSAHDQALFSNIVGGTIKNLSLTSVDITGGENTAGLAAHITNGTVSHVNIQGNVTGTSVVAGLASATTGTSLNGVSFTGTVTNSGAWTAGLVTFLAGSQIHNGFVNGSVSGTNVGGGITAYASAADGQTTEINECLAYANKRLPSLSVELCSGAGLRHH